MLMRISSVEFVQGLLATVHLRVVEPPICNPVIPDVGEEGVVMVADPDILDHVPVPMVGEFPAKVVVVVLQRL